MYAIRSYYAASVTVGPSTTFPYTFDVATANDVLIEGDETLTVTLVDPESPDSAQVSVAGSANATVTSEDVAALGIATVTASVAEGGNAQFSIRITSYNVCYTKLLR